MKTPDEIKKGLECCSKTNGSDFCKKCPYDANGCGTICIPAVTADALIYIKQLEVKVAKLERERDAAINELSYLRPCSICGKHISEGNDCYGNHKCGNNNPDWKWRGPCKENGGAENA